MNTPNPLIPQGSLQQQQSSGKSTVRIAVFTIVAIHAVFFTGLLIQGCKPEGADSAGQSGEPSNALAELGKLTNEYYSSVHELPSIPSVSPESGRAANSNSEITRSTNFAPSQPVVPKQDAPVNLTPSVVQDPSKTPAPEPPAPTPGAPKEYVVVANDSFWKIATLHNISVDALKEANPTVNPSKIWPNQKLVIPSAPPPSGRASGKSASGNSANGNGQFHIVRGGEYLIKIADRYGTTVQALRAANHLKSDRISVGQKLRLPAGSNAAPAALSATNRGGSKDSGR